MIPIFQMTFSFCRYFILLYFIVKFNTIQKKVIYYVLRRKLNESNMSGQMEKTKLFTENCSLCKNNKNNINRVHIGDLQK